MTVKGIMYCSTIEATLKKRFDIGIGQDSF